MAGFRNFGLMIALAVVGACTNYDTATRDVPLDATLGEDGTEVTLAPAPFRLVEGRVIVPEALSVSEANMYFPVADIVWREDPLGNRHEQVAAIFETAFEDALGSGSGSVPVVAEITLERFHSLTEKARYTVGGRHAIYFSLRILDAESGENLVPPRQVNASFPAFGGGRAIAEEAKGNGQKVRILDQLTRVIVAEINAPLVPVEPEA